ncbi:MAG: hypothetical protein JXQ75_09185, partial [Phycisphaerae bacterium]|nr:hypothetical protein [Phycisphaerae bacterium]
MSRWTNSILTVAFSALVVGSVPALATTSIDVSLVNPGSSTVSSGTPFELWVVADISGARLCAASYRLSASSSGGNA